MLREIIKQKKQQEEIAKTQATQQQEEEQKKKEAKHIEKQVIYKWFTQFLIRSISESILKLFAKCRQSLEKSFRARKEDI